jgi:hypothetical protein
MECTGETAFEDVIYGSESEVDSEEEQVKGHTQFKRPLKSALKGPSGSARLEYNVYWWVYAWSSRVDQVPQGHATAST